MNPRFEIPVSELDFSFSRSGGPGGQNVNKLETKVTARWNFQRSGSLSEHQKHLIAEKLKNRIGEEGELIVSSQTERLQGRNRQRAISVMNGLVNAALAEPRKRKKTKVPFRSREKRLEAKRKISEKKKSRRDIDSY